jgi:hypothetical protein
MHGLVSSFNRNNMGKKLLVSLGQKQKNMVVIHSNNQSTIVFIENLKFHL